MAEKEYIGKWQAVNILIDVENQAQRKKPIDGDTLYKELCAAEIQIGKLPTADVTPVKHGHWQKGEVFERLADEVLIYDYTCTCCGWSCRCEEKLDFNFCPNCGADMRENT